MCGRLKFLNIFPDDHEGEGRAHAELDRAVEKCYRPEPFNSDRERVEYLFRLYEKLAGMTGTAMTSAEEFKKVYEIDSIEVPTNKKMIRKDFPDIIFKTEEEKFRAIARKIKEVYGTQCSGKGGKSSRSRELKSV